MAERGRIKVGTDYDGVVVEKPQQWDLLRRPSKFGLRTLSGASDVLGALSAEPSVDFLVRTP